MRRALVISLLFHLLVLASLFELRLLPSYSAPFARGAVPLTVDFNSVQAQRGLAPNQHGQAAIITSVKAYAAASHAPSAATGARVHRRVLEKSVSRTEPPPLPGLPREDGLTGLPVDVESEYRLNIARELRHAGFFSQRRDGGYPVGVVRLLISYQAGLSMPVVSLDRSSGQSEFDAQAMAGLSMALTRVQLPATAIGVSFKMSFVLDYGPAR